MKADLDLLMSVPGLSKIICEFVELCIVVIEPLKIPNFSSMTFTIGARQFVVQLAPVIISKSLFLNKWELIPYTKFKALSS